MYCQFQSMEEDLHSQYYTINQIYLNKKAQLLDWAFFVMIYL